MARFIELTDKNNRNTLINLDHIISIVIYKAPEEEVRIYQTGDSDSYITVKESYLEIKEKLKGVAEILDFNS